MDRLTVVTRDGLAKEAENALMGAFGLYPDDI
jgi:hypothetical protein